MEGELRIRVLRPDQPEVFTGSEVLEQPVLLKHHTDATLRYSGHLPGGRLQQSGDEAQQCGFPQTGTA